MVSYNKCPGCTHAAVFNDHFLNVVKYNTNARVDPNLTLVSICEYFFLSFTTENKVMIALMNDRNSRCHNADGLHFRLIKFAIELLSHIFRTGWYLFPKYANGQGWCFA